MKIEVLATLKGSIGEMFYKGDVFISPNIPQTIMEELSDSRGLVRIVEEYTVQETDSTVADIPIVAPATSSPKMKKRPRMTR
jgi:hypothetical protein